MRPHGAERCSGVALAMVPDVVLVSLVLPNQSQGLDGGSKFNRNPRKKDRGRTRSPICSFFVPKWQRRADDEAFVLATV